MAAAPVQPTVFGVPMTQPGQGGSSRQSRRRNAANQEANATRSRRLIIKTMMVLFPRDVSIIFHIFHALLKLPFFFSSMDLIKTLMDSRISAALKKENN
jgi:hypothetical protein